MNQVTVNNSGKTIPAAEVIPGKSSYGQIVSVNDGKFGVVIPVERETTTPDRPPLGGSVTINNSGSFINLTR